MLKDNHVLELIPAYVLGSLEGDEAHQVVDHVAECYTCRSELDSYQSVADKMLLMAPEAAPPAELKSRLLERVQRLNHHRAPEPRVRRLPMRLFPVGVVAGLLLIAILAASNRWMWSRLRNAEVLTGPLGMRAVALQNTASAAGASGFVIVSADGKNGVLVVDKLPPLDEAHEYQVWLKRDSKETGVATFSVDEDGYRGLRLNAPESLLTYASARVTVEPTGGSAQPTGPQVLSGSLFNSEAR